MVLSQVPLAIVATARGRVPDPIIVPSIGRPCRRSPPPRAPRRGCACSRERAFLEAHQGRLAASYAGRRRRRAAAGGHPGWLDVLDEAGFDAPLPLPGDGAARQLPGDGGVLPAARSRHAHRRSRRPHRRSRRAVRLGGTNVDARRRARGRSPEGMAAHRAAIDVIAELTRTRPRPRVVAGDFNATPYNKTMHQMEDLGLESAHRLRGTRARGHRPNGKHLVPPMQLDHVLVDDALVVLDIRRAAGFGLGSQAGARRPGGDAEPVSTARPVHWRGDPPFYRAHLRVPDERARLGAHRGAARGRRAWSATDDLDDRRRRRPQHVLHPRERRQQALRPPRPPEGAEGTRGPTSRSRSAAASPRRTATDRASGAGHVDVVFGTHNLAHRAAELLAAARARRADRRDPRGARGVPVGAAGPARASITRRGSRSRSAATTRARSASCRRARPGGQPPHGRHRARGRGARRRRRRARSRCSARTSTPTAATSAPGQYRARSSPTCCARVDAVDGIERIRFTSPHPKDLRPETIAAMAECAAVCEHLHLPLQSGSDRTLARMHRGYTAERYLDAARRRARRDPRPRGHHRPHRRLPRRDRRRLRAHARGRRRGRRTTPPTRSCSRPGPAPQPPTMVDDFVPAEVAQERMRAARRGRRAHALAAPRGARRPGRGGARRGPVEEGRRGAGRAAPARTSSCTSRRRAGRAASAASTSTSRDHGRGARTGCGASSSARSGRRRAPRPHPGVGRRLVTPSPRARRPDRVRASRRSRSRSRGAFGDVEIVSLDSMQVYRGHGHRHRQADAPPSAPRCRTISSTSPTRPRTGRSRGTQAAARAAIADIEARGQRALLVGGTGLYVRAVVDDLAFPARTSPCAPRSTPRRRPRRPRARLRPAAHGSTRSPRRASSPNNRRRIVRALEVIDIDRPAVLVVRPGLRHVRAARVRGPHRRGLARRAPCSHDRIAARVRGDARPPGCVDEVRGLAAARTRCPAPPRRRSATGDRSRTSRRAAVARRRVRRGRAPHPAVRRAASACGSGATPASQWIGTGGNPQELAPAILAIWTDSAPAARVTTSMHLSKLHATGNDFLVRLALDEPAGALDAPRRRRAVRPPPRRSVPTG